MIRIELNQLQRKALIDYVGADKMSNVKLAKTYAVFNMPNDEVCALVQNLKVRAREIKGHGRTPAVHSIARKVNRAIEQAVEAEQAVESEETAEGFTSITGADLTVPGRGDVETCVWTGFGIEVWVRRARGFATEYTVYRAGEMVMATVSADHAAMVVNAVAAEV